MELFTLDPLNHFDGALRKESIFHSPQPLRPLCGTLFPKPIRLPQMLQYMEEARTPSTSSLTSLPSLTENTCSSPTSIDFWPSDDSGLDISIPRLSPATSAMLLHTPSISEYAKPFLNFRDTRHGEWIEGDETPKQRHYVPARTHQPPPRPLEIFICPSPSKLLFNAFDRFRLARDCLSINRCARAIVQCGYSWTQNEIFELARIFVWRATEPIGHPSPYGDFASVVREELFRFSPLTNTRELFSATLECTVVGAFVGCWHSSEHKKAAIFRFTKRNSDSDVEHVLSALQLCLFIGGLYRNRFISRSNTVNCIRVILYNVSSIEHLVAIDYILLEAGRRFWKDAGILHVEIPEFKRVLLEAAAHIEENNSLIQILYTLPNGLSATHLRVSSILARVDADYQSLLGSENHHNEKFATAFL